MVPLIALVIAGCNSVPKADAEAFLSKVENIASSGAPQDKHTSLLMSACSEIPSCAGACGEVFKTAPKYAEDDQARLVAQCSSDFREASGRPAKLSLDAWMRRHIGHYINGIRTQLDDGQQGRLDAAIQRLGN